MKPADLEEHPEGGRFREVFRSGREVIRGGGDARPALTHIYFSLSPGEVSRFHKVSSDEVWNLYRGRGLRLYVWDETSSPPETIVLSSESNRFCHVVPANAWQAAEPISETVLAGCTVAPGFEFSDFELMDPVSEQADMLRELDPALSDYIAP